MYPEHLRPVQPLSPTAMSDRETTFGRIDDLYLPAMTARPTFGRLEAFLTRHLGRYGVVRIPYDALSR